MKETSTLHIQHIMNISFSLFREPIS